MNRVLCFALALVPCTGALVLTQLSLSGPARGLLNAAYFITVGVAIAANASWATV